MKWIVLILGCLLLTSCQSPAPFSVVHRESLVGLGRVAIITNNSEETLYNCKIFVEAKDGSTLGPLLFRRELGAHRYIELGWNELHGWPILVGQKLTFYADGYSELTFTVIL